MEKQKHTFRDTIKRFLQYLQYIDRNAIIYFICETYDALQPIFLIQVTTSIIKSIENNDSEQLVFFVRIFGILVVTQYIASWIGEVMHDKAFNAIESKLTTRYMSEYINMDHTKTEIYGTGKLHNIFSHATNAICGIILET